MRFRIAVASLAAVLATAPVAGAQGDPTMPLSEVRPGMDCTAYSVFHGTEPQSFDAEVLDIVGGQGGARILVRVSGGPVEETGIGAGFSGSPVYCPGSDNRLRNAGAISETIGDYGGRTVLVTPIEQILAADVDPPPEPGRAAGAPESGRDLAAISVGGLSPRVLAALQRAGRRSGLTFLPAAPMPLRDQASPAPAAGFKPGSSVGVGLSSGDISVAAIGTVAYVDGDRLWALGHQFDGVGARAIFLQDAYVASVIANPIQVGEIGGTYKLAGSMSNRGTITNDTFSAVAGRIGGLPPSVPVRIWSREEDSGRELSAEVHVADETDAGRPTGSSPLAFVAPLAITQAASGLYDSTPVRIAGDMCLRITLRERPRPIRICNRYVADGTAASVTQGGHLVALRAASDVAEALGLIDDYLPSDLHVTEVAARIKVRRGQQQAMMRRLVLPQRVRRGQRVTARLDVRRIRGATERIRFPLRIPSGVSPGRHRVVLRGPGADTADDDVFGTITIDLGEPEDDEEQDTGPRTVDALVSEIRKLQRYDGIRMSLRGSRRAYRHPRLRIGGRASATVTVVRR